MLSSMATIDGLKGHCSTSSKIKDLPLRVSVGSGNYGEGSRVLLTSEGNGQDGTYALIELQLTGLQARELAEKLVEMGKHVES